MMKLLEGVIVLDFCQFLSGPSAAMRLGDLGARVIKVERPGVGDSGRQLTLNNLMSDGDSVNFQIINRGKESYAADLKNPEDLKSVRRLIDRADVMISNFRPGIMERMGLDYETVKKTNPGIVYGTVTGYGTEGPWVKKPGQDLLAQVISGAAYLTGDRDDPPIALGLSLADSITGTHLAQGLLACLVRRGKTGVGGKVEVSLLESMMDLQFESFSNYLNGDGRLPQRSKLGNANVDLGAPYGIYKTKDGFIAVSMGSVKALGALLDEPGLMGDDDPMEKRDELKDIIARRLATDTTAHWLEVLQKGDFWCGEIYDWDQMERSEFFTALDTLIDIRRPDLKDPIWTTKCPIRVNGKRAGEGTFAPRLGADTEKLRREFGL